ncbi:hypothetical protein BDQ17DRAFT_896222 [Cyathus striatus]|nr:hypothetical protein BDQ17DRAFT_896222 [Cyathus striatus]
MGLRAAYMPQGPPHHTCVLPAFTFARNVFCVAVNVWAIDAIFATRALGRDISFVAHTLDALSFGVGFFLSFVLSLAFRDLLAASCHSVPRLLMFKRFQ